MYHASQLRTERTALIALPLAVAAPTADFTRRSRPFARAEWRDGSCRWHFE